MRPGRRRRPRGQRVQLQENAAPGSTSRSLGAAAASRVCAMTSTARSPSATSAGGSQLVDEPSASGCWREVLGALILVRTIEPELNGRGGPAPGRRAEELRAAPARRRRGGGVAVIVIVVAGSGPSSASPSHTTTKRRRESARGSPRRRRTATRRHAWVSQARLEVPTVFQDPQCPFCRQWNVDTFDGGRELRPHGPDQDNRVPRRRRDRRGQQPRRVAGRVRGRAAELAYSADACVERQGAERLAGRRPPSCATPPKRSG